MIERILQQCKSLNQLKQIHGNLVKFPPSHSATVTSLLSFAAASTNPGFFSYASLIFQNLRFRTTFQYNIMIRGFLQSNQPTLAVLCYKDMLNDGLIKNNYTFTPLVKACSFILIDSPHIGDLIHAHIVKLGFSIDLFIASSLIDFYALKLDMLSAEKLFDEIPVRDVVLWTVMIDGYGKLGNIEKARRVFDEMPERNVISWSAIMAAYLRISDFRQVLCLYTRMEEVGLKPNESIIATAVTACAHLGALGQGLWIHSYAEKCRYIGNSILATAFVDMYSKCGRIELALSVFAMIVDKDVGAWNAIISGVAMNGDATKSLALFDEMVLSGVEPNETTFVAAMTACTHAKMVDKGLALFSDMERVFNIEPKIEHYACLVDLLARSGRLEEAEKFIDEKMGGIVYADANIWGALLGGCRIYGRVDIGNRLWRQLAEKGLGDYGIHVLVYNMYKEARWGVEAKGVRSLIEKQKMKKKPGCSAIEINGSIEEFLAGDVLHRQATQICSTLYSLLLCNASSSSSSITLNEYDEITYV